MPGGFLIYRADEIGEIVYANKAVWKMFGCESLEEFKELSGFTFRGMVHPLDYERISSWIMNQAKETGTDSDHAEYRILCKGGKIRWIDSCAHFADTGNGEQLYYLFLSEITELREQAESERALRTAVIEALTKVYDSVWLITDPKQEKFELFRVDEELAHLLPASAAAKITRFRDAFSFYSNLIYEEDRAMFLEAVKSENIVRNTEEKPVYSVPFRRVFENGIRHYRLEFAKFSVGS